MADSEWDLRLKSFLKKAGEDFRRFGDDLKEEASHLMTEVQDPERQKKFKEGLREVGTWSLKIAEEVATVVEDGMKQAEGVIGKAGAAVSDFVTRPTTSDPAAPTPSAAPTPPNAAAAPAQPPAPAAHPEKTVGPRPSAVASPDLAQPKPPKTIGPKPREAEED
jgi:hypothetical protein